MRNVRGFRLVLRADVWDGVGECAVRTLKEAVVAEKAKRGFDTRFPEPAVIYSPRKSPAADTSEFWEDDPFYWTPLQ